MEKTYNLSVTVPFEDSSRIPHADNRDIKIFNTVTADYESAADFTFEKFNHCMEENKLAATEGRTPVYLAKLMLSFIPEKLARQTLASVLYSNTRILKIDFTENP